MITTRHVYSARFGILTFVLIFSLILVLAGIVISRKSPENGCVIYDPGPKYFLSLFDARTGQHAYSSFLSRQTIPYSPEQHLGPAHLNGLVMYPPIGSYDTDYEQMIQRKPSPSGHYIAVLQNHSSGTTLSITGANTRFVDDKSVYDMIWTQENKLIYVNQNGELVEADPQTGEKRSGWQPGFANDYSVAGISPNGSFVVEWDASGSTTVLSTSALFGSTSAASSNWPTFQISNRDTWIAWSPNSRYFAVMRSSDSLGTGGRSTFTTPLDIFSVDGKGFPSLATLSSQRKPGDETFVDARWSANGNVLLYRKLLPNFGRSDLISFDPQTGIHHVIAENIIGDLSFSFESIFAYDYDAPAQERIAYARDAGDHLVVEILNTNGDVVDVPVSNASHVGDLIWLSDGKTLIIPWSTNSSPLRQAHITAVTANGAPIWDAVDPDQDITEVHWLRVSQRDDQLLYVAQKDGAYSVNMLDLTTGRGRRLADGFHGVTGLAWDQSLQAVSFWWQHGKLYGTDQYLADGTRVYRFPAVGPASAGGMVYPAPDGKLAVLDVENALTSSLQVASVGSKTARVIETRRQFPDELVWSGDSQQFAVFGGQTLEVFSVDGNRKWITDPPNNPLYWNGPGLSFGRCLPVF